MQLGISGISPLLRLEIPNFSLGTSSELLDYDSAMRKMLRSLRPNHSSFLYA